MFQAPEDIVATSREFFGSSFRLLELFSIECWTLSPPPSFCCDLRNSENSAGNGCGLTENSKNKQNSSRAVKRSSLAQVLEDCLQLLLRLTDPIFIGCSNCPQVQINHFEIFFREFYSKTKSIFSKIFSIWL